MEEQIKLITEQLLALSSDQEKTKELVQELFLSIGAKVAFEIKKELDTNPNFMDQFKD